MLGRDENIMLRGNLVAREQGREDKTVAIYLQKNFFIIISIIITLESAGHTRRPHDSV